MGTGELKLYPVKTKINLRPLRIENNGDKDLEKQPEKNYYKLYDKDPTRLIQLIIQL